MSKVDHVPRKKNRSNNPAAELAVAPKQSNPPQKLPDADRACFLNEGFHNTRPQDIARKTSVASGTFYFQGVTLQLSSKRFQGMNKEQSEKKEYE